MPKYLLCDVGSTFTKTCLVDTDHETILAVSARATTIDQDINIGLENALAGLEADTGNVCATLVCSSAAGGLKIAAVGLVPELTLKAANIAALGAGGKVMGTFGYRLTAQDMASLSAIRPDLILLTGGTDGGDSQYIIHNARRLREDADGIPVVVAGNRNANDELRAIFAGRQDVYFTENVLPDINHLNPDPAREQIRKVFLERIVAAKGLDRLHRRAKVLMPTPEAVFLAARLLSQGHHGQEGLGELLIVDIGGATTDVYSCAAGCPTSPQSIPRGLIEPFFKRTVEADVGMRHTLRFLMEQVGVDLLAVETQATAGQIEEFVATATAQPWLLPTEPCLRRIDRMFARLAVRIAVTRHAGTLREAYSPQGRLFIQEGKDLSAVRCVIGSGGPVVHSDEPLDILQGCRRDGDTLNLRPTEPDFYLDRDYILWAMGLLAQEAPACALSILKKHIVPLPRM